VSRMFLNWLIFGKFNSAKVFICYLQETPTRINFHTEFLNFLQEKGSDFGR